MTPVTLAATAVGLTLALAGAAEGGDAGPRPTEPQIKAAFIYNFVRFTEWPEAVLPAGQPIVIGVLGTGPFDELKEIVRGRTVNGRELKVQHHLAPEQAEACHLLFVGASQERKVSRILQALHGAHVLTVGETEGFAPAGGVIGFTVEQNKVRFEVNLAAAERAELKISSQLLRLARIVRDQSPEAP